MSSDPTQGKTLATSQPDPVLAPGGPDANGYPANPVQVRAWRGAFVESVHRGSWVRVDADGALLQSSGAAQQPYFVRSAIKCVQALPLVESGAADRFGYSPGELALALASHNGEEQHTRGVHALLERLGLGVEALQCGAQSPGDPEARQALEQQGARPSALHNNCSGKHAGFLALARHLDADPAHYLDVEGPVQRAVRQAVLDLTGCAAAHLDWAVDGCSAPTWRLPLSGLATAFARVGTPEGLAPARARACRRMTDAAALEPEKIAGRHKRVCTALLRASQGRLFPKIGAEGVYAVAHVERGEALALKMDDGGARGLHALLLSLLERFGWLEGAALEDLRRFSEPLVSNWAGRVVGRLEVLDA